MEALVPFEPGADLGVLVRRIVVDDQVQLRSGRGLAVDVIEEANRISGLRVVFQHNGNDAANYILRHVNQILVPSVGAAGILDDLVTRKIVDAIKFAIELLCHCP